MATAIAARHVYKHRGTGLTGHCRPACAEGRPRRRQRPTGLGHCSNEVFDGLPAQTIWLKFHPERSAVLKHKPLALRQSVVWKKESDQFPSCLARVKCVFRVILLDADWPAVKMLAGAAGPARGWSGQRPVRVLVGKMCHKQHQKQSP